MKKSRPGFIFKLALVAVSLLGIALIVLIVMFYRAKTDVRSTFSPPPEELVASIQESDADTYLENIENYKDNIGASLSDEELEKNDQTNLVIRGSEVGENSMVKAIDDIVLEALDHSSIAE